MNRREWRAEIARQRKALASREVRIHEAGHAVSALLTSSDMGHAPEEAISSIELGGGGCFGPSQDSRMILRQQGICYSPVLSNQLAEICGPFLDRDRNWSRREVFALAMDKGDHKDVERCLAAHMLFCVMGAVSEARDTGKDPLKMFKSYPCEHDRLSFIGDCEILGMHDELIELVEKAYVEVAADLVARPAVWRAIGAIAQKLKATMPGKVAAQLAWPHLDRDPLALGLARTAVNSLGTLEDALRLNFRSGRDGGEEPCADGHV